MFKALLVAFTLTLGFNASALDMNQAIVSPELLQNYTMQLAEKSPQMINWTVGENADYSLSTGFLPGTMKMLVREETEQGYWIEQNIDLLIQKQKVEIHLDKNTGEIIEVLVNGKAEELPDQGEVEVVDNKEDTVTVKAGTFDCIYIKTKNEKGDEAEAWANPQEVSVFGLIKQVAAQQGQSVTMELTAFDKK